MISKVLSLMKVLVVGYVVTALLLLGMAWCVYKFNFGDVQADIGVIAIYMLVNLLGGFLLGYIHKSKRLIWGVIYGVSYFIILCVISFIISGGNINIINALKSVAVCVIAGGIGSVIAK